MPQTTETIDKDGHIEQEHLNQQIVIFNRNDGGMIFSQLTNSSTEHPL